MFIKTENGIIDLEKEIELLKNQYVYVSYIEYENNGFDLSVRARKNLYRNIKQEDKEEQYEKKEG